MNMKKMKKIQLGFRNLKCNKAYIISIYSEKNNKEFIVD